MLLPPRRHDCLWKTHRREGKKDEKRSVQANKGSKRASCKVPEPGDTGKAEAAKRQNREARKCDAVPESKSAGKSGTDAIKSIASHNSYADTNRREISVA